jgi:hypothetical protein
VAGFVSEANSHCGRWRAVRGSTGRAEPAGFGARGSTRSRRRTPQPNARARARSIRSKRWDRRPGSCSRRCGRTPCQAPSSFSATRRSRSRWTSTDTCCRTWTSRSLMLSTNLLLPMCCLQPRWPWLRRCRRLKKRCRDLRFRAVEVIGFEPTTPALRTQCSTGLSYTPVVRGRSVAEGSDRPAQAGCARSASACRSRASCRSRWTNAIERSPLVFSIKDRATSVDRRRFIVIASG